MNTLDSNYSWYIYVAEFWILRAKERWRSASIDKEPGEREWVNLCALWKFSREWCLVKKTLQNEVDWADIQIIYWMRL